MPSTDNGAERSMEERMEAMLERERTARMHSRWLHASSFENRVLAERNKELTRQLKDARQAQHKLQLEYSKMRRKVTPKRAHTPSSLAPHSRRLDQAGTPLPSPGGSARSPIHSPSRSPSKSPYRCADQAAQSPPPSMPAKEGITPDAKAAATSAVKSLQQRDTGPAMMRPATMRATDGGAFGAAGSKPSSTSGGKQAAAAAAVAAA